MLVFEQEELCEEEVARAEAARAEAGFCELKVGMVEKVAAEVSAKELEEFRLWKQDEAKENYAIINGA